MMFIKIGLIFSAAVIRESISNIVAALRRIAQRFKKSKISASSLGLMTGKFAEYRESISSKDSQSQSYVLLDAFPIPHWLLPNMILSGKIAQECDSKVAIFSFRKLDLQSMRMHRSFGIEKFFVVRIKLFRIHHLYRQFRLIVEYLLSGSKLIDYEIEGIPIGLDIYESILRSGKATLGSSDLQMFRQIYLATKQYVFFKKDFESGKITAVLLSHDSYIGPGLLAHMAFRYEIPLIMVNLLGLSVPTRPFQLYERLERYPTYANALPSNELLVGKQWAKEELLKRLSGEVGVGMTYQQQSAFGSQKVSRQTSNSAKTKILVVAHDFFDNPHGYARMIFDDFLQWLEYLARIALLSDKEWYIKPHRDYSEIEMNILKEFNRKNPRFILINADTSYHQLREEGIKYALSCYGSAGHELPFLGYVVINASYNPHVAYNFNIHSKSIPEYEDILLNIERYDNFSINFDEIYEFYFIHHRIIATDGFAGISYNDFISVTNGEFGSEIEMRYLLTNFDKIRDNMLQHLEEARSTRRVFSFEKILPRHQQTIVPMGNQENCFFTD